jgi:solute carrier family 25 protein 39/40
VGFGKELGRHCKHSRTFSRSSLMLINYFRVIGVPSSTCYMLTYDHLLRVVLPPILPYESLVPLTAGILARTSISSLLSPLELIRTNLQSTPKSSANPHTLTSVLTSIRGLVRDQGVRSLWRGLGPTLWRDVPFSGIYWASYEGWKKVFQRRGQNGAWVAFLSGAVSGTSAALITSPFDVLKTRRQALVMQSTAASIRTPTGSLPLLANIIRTEGMSALFAGILPRTAKIAPACGIMISCFEVRSPHPRRARQLLMIFFQGVGKFLEKKDP